MMDNDFTSLDKIQQSINECAKKPELFLSVQESVAEKLKNHTKSLYDLTFKTQTSKSSKSGALPALIVNGFDNEQIWQQLELENNLEFGRLNLEKISKTLASNKSWSLPLKLEQENKTQTSNDSDVEDEEAQDMCLSDDVNEDNLHENEKLQNKKISSSLKKRRHNTEVDDKFFKLDQLDEYLKKEDKKEVNTKKTDDDSSNEDNESIDLFNNLSDPEEEEEEEEENGRSIKYADFFDDPESGGEEPDKRNEENIGERFNDNESNEPGSENEDEINEMQHKLKHKKEKKVKFDLMSDSEETDSSEDAGKSKKLKINNDNVKSSLEARQERLKTRIEELEKEAISEKPWQLKGEASATSRPQNSLLEEFVEFDTVTRPAPIMTEQTTMKLEDIIRARIKDKAWDDVEKKVKPVETPLEYKKKLILNQEKSKESLAQIYENEYIKQREALNAEDKDEVEKEEPPEHIEIKERMHSLFQKLDALSNFHYTPKPAKPEIKIVSNLPAITMEEVAPISVSDATLLAPEEVHSKLKGELIGKSERSKTDMKRARRKKKIKQHVRAVNESGKEITKKKKSQKNDVGKLKGRNIINVTEESYKNDAKSVKTSQGFFAKLQDEVESSIKAKTSTKKTKKNKDEVSAVKLKL